MAAATSLVVERGRVMSLGVEGGRRVFRGCVTGRCGECDRCCHRDQAARQLRRGVARIVYRRPWLLEGAPRFVVGAVWGLATARNEIAGAHETLRSLAGDGEPRCTCGGQYDHDRDDPLCEVCCADRDLRNWTAAWRQDADSLGRWTLEWLRAQRGAS